MSIEGTENQPHSVSPTIYRQLYLNELGLLDSKVTTKHMHLDIHSLNIDDPDERNVKATHLCDEVNASYFSLHSPLSSEFKSPTPANRLHQAPPLSAQKRYTSKLHKNTDSFESPLLVSANTGDPSENSTCEKQNFVEQGNTSQFDWIDTLFMSFVQEKDEFYQPEITDSKEIAVNCTNGALDKYPEVKVSYTKVQEPTYFDRNCQDDKTCNLGYKIRCAVASVLLESKTSVECTTDLNMLMEKHLNHREFSLWNSIQYVISNYEDSSNQ